MKKMISVAVAAMMLVSASCSKNAVIVTDVRETMPVKVIKAEVETFDDELLYIGAVTPEQVRKLSFKTAGKITDVYVSKGDRVEKGQVLARLDMSDYVISREAAASGLKAAEIQVSTAEEVYRYTVEQFGSTEALYADGAISQDTYDQAKTNLKVREDELSSARELRDQAKSQVASVDKVIADSTIIAPDSCTIAEVLYEANEIVSAGYPVMAVRSDGQKVSVGISSKDVDDISVGMETEVGYKGTDCAGTITYIAEIPDTVTMTYEAEITLAEGVFRIGNIVDVAIIKGSQQGIWIPDSVLLHDGRSYVFTANGNTAARKYVEVQSHKGGMALVEGLVDGDLVVSENMSYIRDGDTVTVMED